MREDIDAVEADKLGKNFPELFLSLVVNIFECIDYFTHVVRRLKGKPVSLFPLLLHNIFYLHITEIFDFILVIF